jgi:hypothetical protein
MKILGVGLTAVTLWAAFAACGGTDGNLGTGVPVTCGEGTHRCCSAQGFVCVPLATACALSDSACTNPVDASSPDAGSAPDSSAPDTGYDGGVCPTTTVTACWLGPNPISCTADSQCPVPSGATCNTSTGVCECPDCENGGFCGGVVCVTGTLCEVAYPGEHPTCRCDPSNGNPCTPPP